jgi:hypothetical protein
VEKNDDEFLLVGVQGRRPMRPTNLEEVRPAIERLLLAEKQQETIRKWLEEQEKKAEIEIIHKPGETKEKGDQS